MRSQRNTTAPSESSNKRARSRLFAGTSPFTSWTARLGVPLVVVALVFAGVSSPANAEDAAPATDPAATSAPAATPPTDSGTPPTDSSTPPAPAPADPTPPADPPAVTPPAPTPPATDTAPTPPSPSPAPQTSTDSSTPPTPPAPPVTPPAPAARAALTTSSVPATPPTWDVSKTSDPPTGSAVMPGQKINYVITVTNTGGTLPASLTITDHLNKAFTNAAFTGTLDASSGTAAFQSTDLIWTLTSFSGPQTLKYSLIVDKNAFNVDIHNVLVVPSGGTCVSTCTTDNFTPHFTLQKSSDPASGSTVDPGQTVNYTLSAHNDSQATLTGGTAVDSLSGVLGAASLVTPLPAGVTFDSGTQKLTWTIPDLAPGATATVTYSVVVGASSAGLTLTNVVKPGPGGTCPYDSYGNTGSGGTPPTCTTTLKVNQSRAVPHWILVKTSDPASGSVVEPGQTIAYTLTATNDSAATVAGATASDDLTNVLTHAALTGALPAGLVLTASGTSLTWTIPTLAPGASASVTFTVKVDADAANVSIDNVAIPGSGGSCPYPDGENSASCTTTHHVPEIDLSIVKTHTTDQGGVVDSGKGEIITYTLTVHNAGPDAATGVVVTDTIPTGLTYVSGSAVMPAGWTVDVTNGVVTAHHPATFPSGTTAVITFQATVGTLDRSGPTVPFPDIVNSTCVTGTEHDSDSTNNCSTDKTHVKSIAVNVQSLCVNDAPLVSYSVTPNHVSATPTIALIWWTPSAYAGRDPSIPAADQAALLADGASQVDYIPVPAGWVNGQTISGTQLWPGAGVDASGRGNAWPGWRQLPDGTWVLDPAAPFYDIRNDAVVEVRINPTTASTVAYPPPSTHCTPTNPTPPTSTAGNELASTGTDITGPLITGGLLLSLGAAMLMLVRRRRPGRAE